MVLWLNVLIWVVLGCLAAVSARSRGRSPLAWFLIGVILGWYGLLLLLVLPPVSLPQQLPSEAQRTVPSDEDSVSEKSQLFSPTGEWFFLDRAKTVCGPFSPQMLKDKWKEGTLFSETWVWNESIVDWKKISQIQPLLTWLQG